VVLFAQALALSAIQQGHRVLYREAHVLLDELATVPLLVIEDLGMRKHPTTAAEDLLELIMRRYERASTLLTSNRPVDDRGKLLGDTAAVSSLLDRLLHHAHVLQCGARSWRTHVPDNLPVTDVGACCHSAARPLGITTDYTTTRRSGVSFLIVTDRSGDLEIVARW
jgi:hypothetical protein